jgi:hypothetical protein
MVHLHGGTGGGQVDQRPPHCFPLQLQDTRLGAAQPIQKTLWCIDKGPYDGFSERAR